MSAFMLLFGLFLSLFNLMFANISQSFVCESLLFIVAGKGRGGWKKKERVIQKCV